MVADPGDPATAAELDTVGNAVSGGSVAPSDDVPAPVAGSAALEEAAAVAVGSALASAAPGAAVEQEKLS